MDANPHTPEDSPPEGAWLLYDLDHLHGIYRTNADGAATVARLLHDRAAELAAYQAQTAAPMTGDKELQHLQRQVAGEDLELVFRSFDP